MQEIINKYRNYRWFRNFVKCEKNYNYKNFNISKLRFVFGVGRSGTTWLSSTLANTNTPIHFFNEPMNPFIHPMPFWNIGDKNALSYKKKLSSKHPLICLYNFISINNIDWNNYFPVENFIFSNVNPQVILVKEVHALLATEAVLKYFKSPTVFITRNPIYVVDSLLSFMNIQCSIWRTENFFIRNSNFLNIYNFSNRDKLLKYLRIYRDTPSSRESVVIGKAIVVGIINKMFTLLNSNYPNTMLLNYDKLCENPERIFQETSVFFNIAYDDKMKSYIERSTKGNYKDKNPYSVLRNTKSQINRKYKFITDDEAKKIKDIFHECNLMLC